jgi:hypothetical protein
MGTGIVTTLPPPSPHDHSQHFHVLPHLAVPDRPEVWAAVREMLMERGLTYDEALMRIAFAYTGDLFGELPPGAVVSQHG